MLLKSFTLSVVLILSCSLCCAMDWEAANNGLVGYSVADLIIDNTNPNILYCSFKDGVYKSTNGGASWYKTGTLGKTPSPKKLAMDPNNPNTVYVQASDDYGSYIWRTDNGGGTWVKKGTGITLPSIVTVEVSKSNPDVVYCGTIVGGRDGGCYKSTNKGDTWVQVAGSNIPGSGLENDCAPIAIDPINPDILYCGRTFYNDVIKSTDGGYHWTWKGQQYLVRALLIDPSDTNRVFVGGQQHLKLHNAASNTFVEKLAGHEIQWLAAAPSSPSVFYAATNDNGIYKSTDAGETWTQISGSEKYGYGRIAIHPTDPNTVYMVVPGRGVAKSTDSGHTVVFLNTGLPTEMNVSTVAPQPGGRAVYAVVNYVGLYRTYDDGATWQFLSSIPYFPKGFAICRDNPNVMYYVAYPLDKIMKSTDGGLNWSAMPPTPAGDTYFVALAVDPANPDHVIASGYPSNRIITTMDGGQHWQVTSTVTPMPDWWSTSVWSLTIDPTNPNRVYASTYSYPMRSDDGGYTWTKLTGLHYTVMYGSPNPSAKDTSDIRHIAVDPVSPNIIYASTQWGGTWKSTDYGDHWAMVHNKILDTTNNTVVDSRDHNTLWLTSLGYGGQNTGVWKSTDAGATWTNVSSGLTGNDLYPNWIAQGLADPSRLYLGGQTKGFYRTPGTDWGLTIDQAMGLPDGAYCALNQDQVVSLKDNNGWGCIQQLDRLRGVRVSNTGGFEEGDKLHVTGTVMSDNSGKYVLIDKVTKAGTVTPPAALSMGTKAANQAIAPNGVYSRVWGKVNNITADGFYLNDGSFTASDGMRVDSSRIPIPDLGTFAVVEGVMGRSTQGGESVPCLIPLSVDGVLVASVSNYLQNPGFETGASGPWTLSGAGLQIVNGSWYFGTAAHSGSRFAGAYGNFAAYCGTLSQRVTVLPGRSYQASVWSRVFHGGNDTDSAMSRIGIDPTGGSDPASPAIRWSDWDTQPTLYYSEWKQLNTPVTGASGNSCTIFLEYRQQNPSYYHMNSFDDAKLEAIE